MGAVSEKLGVNEKVCGLDTCPFALSKSRSVISKELPLGIGFSILTIFFPFAEIFRGTLLVKKLEEGPTLLITGIPFTPELLNK
jgi:hypothetical protein